MNSATCYLLFYMVTELSLGLVEVFNELLVKN